MSGLGSPGAGTGGGPSRGAGAGGGPSRGAGAGGRPSRGAGAGGLGSPRLHLRRTESTNTRARELAGAGAPHGTLVTAAEQLAGRGRQGRTWTAPRGRALLCSVVVRDPPRLLPLVAGVAVAEVVASVTAERDDDAQTTIKWPNDVHLDGRKVAGILVEGRPQEGWAVVGVGLNVAVRLGDLPPDLRETAATLGLEPDAIDAVLAGLLEALGRWLPAAPAEIVAAFRARDALDGRPLRWSGGEGRGAGVDGDGRLLVAIPDGRQVALNAGEVHLSFGPQS